MLSNLFSDGDFFKLYTYYESFLVEELIETYVYDVVGFLSSAGGNLGLLLGMSCLSASFAFIDRAQIIFNWIKTWKMAEDGDDQRS